MDEDLAAKLAELEAMYSDDEKPKKSKKTDNQKKPSNIENTKILVPSSSEVTINPQDNVAVQSAAAKKKIKKKPEKKGDVAAPANIASQNETVDNEPTSSSVTTSSAKPSTNPPSGKSTTGPPLNKKDAKKEEERIKRAAMIKKLREQQEQEEADRKLKEAEEEKRLEELYRQRAEKERLEKERRERRRLREKEKILQAKKDGTFLTEKQKRDKARFAEMIEARGLKPVGADAEAPVKRVVYTDKKKVSALKKSQEKDDETVLQDAVLVEPVEPSPELVKPCQDDNWETEYEIIQSTTQKPVLSMSSSSSAASEADPCDVGSSLTVDNHRHTEDEDPLLVADRIVRQEHARCEALRSVENLRCPVICVLGHVDTGKTKILDKLRKTNVQDNEAGGITQQIGATNVPAANIQQATRHCAERFDTAGMRLPGLLIIDTPGHESFSNLRDRGSSLCDLAILVVDIVHSIERQTIESIQLLKKRRTPFVVALNKIDRLTQFRSEPGRDVQKVLADQSQATRDHFHSLVKTVVADLAVQEVNACLFYEARPVRGKRLGDDEEEEEDDFVSLVPTSALTGDGMGNLLTYLCQYAQDRLARRLAFSEELQAITMEVKEIQGMGTTVDVILINGQLSEGDTIIVPGQEAPIVTQIRALLQPAPMRDLRVKNAYEHQKTVRGAQGCKICAHDLQKALAGLPMYRSSDPLLVNYYSQKIEANLSAVLKSFTTADIGVHVQASTLGSLEALLTFLKSESVPYASIGIGPMHKKDVIKCNIMNERKHPQWAVILAFDVKIEKEATDLADREGVKIFTADIIYHLHDMLINYIKDVKSSNKERFREAAIFPVKLYILPEAVFCQRSPIIAGVRVDGGQLRVGTPLCVPDREMVEIGRVASMEVNHKPVQTARKGDEVCIRVEPIQGEAPKMYGRHFDAKDIIVSKISRQSIDALREYFRDEMNNDDWKLVKKLKTILSVY